MSLRRHTRDGSSSGWLNAKKHSHRPTQPSQPGAYSLRLALTRSTGHSPPTACRYPAAHPACGQKLRPTRAERRRRPCPSGSSHPQGPLVARANYEGQPGAPHRYRGIGLHHVSLVSQVEVVALLALRPEVPPLRHILVDDNGPALVGRQWRGFLIHAGDYRPLEPAVHGADLLLRPDLYDTLEGAVGTARLALGTAVTTRNKSRQR